MGAFLDHSHPHPSGSRARAREFPADGHGIKILFLNPPSVPYSHLVEGLASPYAAVHQTVAMPMGILYLAAVLERDLPGVEIRIVDLAKAAREYSESEQRRPLRIEEFTALALDGLPSDFVPTVVGLSILFSTAHKSSLCIAAAVKSRWPSVPTVFGGMHATNAVESLLEASAVDYVCRGEAETIISDLVWRLRGGGDPQDLPGVVGRRSLAENRTAAISQMAPTIDDLDEIPFPAWHLLPMREYVSSQDSRVKHLDTIAQDRDATIITTRGCPFQCTFCSSWTVHGRTMRYRSVANVVQELAILQERYGITSVIPEDDLFSVKKPRIIALCKAVAARFQRSIHFQFPNGLSVATLDEDVIEAMVEMGMSLANIAIESGSPHVQRHVIKKNCNLERARGVVQACRDAGIFVRAYFIFGFPGESREMMQETIDFAASLPTDWNVFNVAAPLIGTEMYEQMIALGWIDRTFNWDDAFFQERTFDTPAISARDLKDLTYGANITTNFFGNYNLRMGLHGRAIALFEDVLRSHKGHLIAQYCIAQAQGAMGDALRQEQSLGECRRMLAAEYPLSLSQLAQYRDLMPELADLPADVVEPPGGPRPGMPYRARAAV